MVRSAKGMSCFKVVAIIQARMGSTRLPGKVLKKILNKPMLQYVIDQVKCATCIDDLVVATTTNSKDEQIVEFCKNASVNCFRGSEDNVLSRYYHAAKKYSADCVVRVCSDSPLIDPSVIDRVVKIFTEDGANYDYVSNTLNQTYPLGMNVEVFSLEALEKSFLNHAGEYQREHVTPYIYQNTNLFKIFKEQLEVDYSHLRLTVDEKQDFILVKEIIKEIQSINETFRMSDIIGLYNSNPNLFLLNSNVVQKNCF